MKKSILLILFSCLICRVIAYAQPVKHAATSTLLSCNPWIIAGIATLIATVIVIVASYLFFTRKLIRTIDERRRFFLRMAHDVRTPISLIKAPLEELRTQEGLPGGVQANVNIALRNLDTLSQLTTNLIQLDRTDTVDRSLHLSEHELKGYIEEIIRQFSSCASAKHITLSHESGFENLNVWLDKEKMDSILKNILSNAIKYTPENGKVTVSTEASSREWSISVKDTGIGIPLSEQKRLTGSSFHYHRAISRYRLTEGGGTGLFLIARLTALHKGKIKLQSEKEKGTLIRLSFPKDKKKFPKALQVSKQELPRSPLFAMENGSSPIQEENNLNVKTMVENHSSKSKLLIVEENSELREHLQQILAGEYIIRSYSDGLQALEKVKEYAPDLIISDVIIPGMRGDELCRTLKNDIETSHIPFILLTALNHEKNIIDGLMSGADEYIVKPFNTGILKATIANLLNNRALLRQKYAHPEISNQANDDCINCATDLDWKFILTVRKHVGENMDNSTFNVDVLCNLMNMSRTSFYNKIKALTDQAPADYVRLIRLTHSARLLQEQRYSITEIAEMTGFNDAKYFREVFKKHFKVSPSQYAKKKQPEENLNPE